MPRKKDFKCKASLGCIEILKSDPLSTTEKIYEAVPFFTSSLEMGISTPIIPALWRQRQKNFCRRGDREGRRTTEKREKRKRREWYTGPFQGNDTFYYLPKTYFTIHLKFHIYKFILKQSETYNKNQVRDNVEAFFFLN